MANDDMPRSRSPRSSGLRGTSLKRTDEPQRSEIQRVKAPRRANATDRQRTTQRRGRMKPGAVSPASPAQRAKIKDQPCVCCGKRATTPMHLWPRGQGGCDDPLCVLPACWECHRLYDLGELELLRHIVENFKAEIAHAQTHTDPISLLERLTGCDVELHPRRRAATPPDARK
jgi:hypothetical protein